MWPLLACSVLIISISIEKSWFLQNRLISPKGLSNQIVNLLKKDLMNSKQASEISNLSSLGFLLINCIKYKDLPRENLESKSNFFFKPLITKLAFSAWYTEFNCFKIIFNPSINTFNWFVNDICPQSTRHAINPPILPIPASEEKREPGISW